MSTDILHHQAPVQDPPSPPTVPILGSALRLDQSKNILFNFLDFWQEYGDLCHVKLGPVHTYIVAAPEHVHHIFVGNPDNYIKGRSYDGFRHLVGNGLVTSDGEHWRRQRRLVQPSFTPRSIQKFTGIMVDSIQRMLARWAPAAESGRVLTMDDEMARLTMSIISRTIFGVDLGEESQEVSHAFHRAFAFVTARTMSAFNPPLPLPLPAHRRFRADRRTIDRFVQAQIGKGRQRGGDDNILAILLQATDEETGRRMSEEQVRDEVVTLFLAGFETTARTLTWCWYLLAQHPAAMAAVQAEAAAVLGRRAPGMADLADLPYTRMVIDETMRLYPPAGMLARQIVADDVIDGYRVRGGGVVMLIPYLTHRYPGVWTEPERFDPERFRPDVEGGGDPAPRPKSAYIPFSGGARICLGNHFALAEMVFTVAMTAARYRLHRTDGAPIGHGFHGSIAPTAPLTMTVEA